jgi:hypothetical protein
MISAREMSLDNEADYDHVIKTSGYDLVFRNPIAVDDLPSVNQP